MTEVAYTLTHSITMLAKENSVLISIGDFISEKSAGIVLRI
ncbi:hypothetical protein APHCRT_0806 [Anaplasma phagocytophilum str. CRT53-1]|uniref:Uncharacterized protein n=1 Tax=Anaplasma phagocytophilum str. CRT53-1 TaxID=1359157 RepID=A0A0F3Q1K5_ANAPH|nr:hypothetical protein APHCRT_0806 [Anaplasma phagocytophilum str. CRT53-1]